MMRLELHKFHEGAINLMVTKTSASGKGYMNAFYSFEPGVVYRTNDPVVKQWVRGEIPGAEVKTIASSGLRQVLDYYQIQYDKTSCGSCATSKPHYIYNPFHIIEDDKND